MLAYCASCIRQDGIFTKILHEQYRKLSPHELLLVRGGLGAVAQDGGWYIGHRHGVLRYRHVGWLRACPLQVVEGDVRFEISGQAQDRL